MYSLVTHSVTIVNVNGVKLCFIDTLQLYIDASVVSLYMLLSMLWMIMILEASVILSPAGHETLVRVGS